MTKPIDGGRLVGAVELEARRKRRKRGGWCETWAASEIEDLIGLARRLKRMAFVVGDPGVGKTMALERYAKADRAVVYCVMAAAESSMIAVLGVVAKAIAGTRGVPFSNQAAGHDYLVRQMSRVECLLIDEAQHVSDWILDELRCIHDETGVTMVFAGNAELRSRFGNVKAAGFGQFLSRIGPRLDLGPSLDDIQALAFHLGADAAAAKWLVERAAGGGNLRTVDMMMAAAREIAEAETIGRADLEAAAVVLGID